MSDQFRRKWDLERRRQRIHKPDYLEEIKLDNQKRRRLTFGQFEFDQDFKAQSPAEFVVAKRNRDRVFSSIEDPLILLMEIQSGEIFAFFPSYSFSEFAEAYKLSLKEKAAKQLFKRLNAYAGAIKTLIKDELRQWPMRAFVKNPFPLEFNFSNKSGMAATVKLVDASS